MAKRSGKDNTGEKARCVVVPAYKEVENLEPLTRRVFKALEQANMASGAELIVVDDNSRDGSKELMDKLSSEYNCRIIVRTTERGLSSAVLRGFYDSGAKHLVCMDADLQHPPEKVPDMFKQLEKNEFSLGTRYGETFAVDKDWPWYRVIISKGGRLLARPLTPLSDPMSGFFGIRREVLDRGEGNINASGFKIALELYTKCRATSLGEVPIFFDKRVAGESKLTGKVMMQYVFHLIDLYRFRFGPLILVLILVFLFLLYKVLLA